MVLTCTILYIKRVCFIGDFLMSHIFRCVAANIYRMLYLTDSENNDRASSSHDCSVTSCHLITNDWGSRWYAFCMHGKKYVWNKSAMHLLFWSLNGGNNSVHLHFKIFHSCSLLQQQPNELSHSLRTVNRMIPFYKTISSYHSVTTRWWY